MLEQRLQLMKESKQISAQTLEKSQQLITLLMQHFLLDQAKSIISLVTHCAIALERTLQHKPLHELDPMVSEEIMQHQYILSAQQCLEMIEQHLNIRFNHPEGVLIMAHLCSFLDHQNEKNSESCQYNTNHCVI